MARAPAHQFGQIIGNTLEKILESQLRRFCTARGLYLDASGQVRGARGGKKLSWQDRFGSRHDLDFVIEQGGSDQQIGEPVAFIETAWRRYTKHSKNKAQEIAGAVLPVAERYASSKPFLGVLLGGKFTDASLTQMRNCGFTVLYIPYEIILRAFAVIGLDAYFDSQSTDEEVQAKVEWYNALPGAAKDRFADEIAKRGPECDRRLHQGTDRALGPHGGPGDRPAVVRPAAGIRLSRSRLAPAQ